MRTSRHTVILIFGICLAALPACTTVGNNALEDVNNFMILKPGVDTKQSIYAKFGQPADVAYTKDVPGPSVWTFVKSDQHLNGWSYVPYVNLLAGGSNQETTKALFSFDAQGRFLEVHTNRDTHYVNTLVGAGQLIGGRSRDQVQRVHDEMDRLGTPFNLKQAKIEGEVRYITAPQLGR